VLSAKFIVIGCWLLVSRKIREGFAAIAAIAIAEQGLRAKSGGGGGAVAGLGLVANQSSASSRYPICKIANLSRQDFKQVASTAYQGWGWKG